MQTVCLSGLHSQELLVNKGCRLLPLCFALEPSGLSDQSSKLVAARRCVADANCLPVWPALAGAACQQRLQPSSSLLCTRAVRALQQIDQACGGSTIRASLRLRVGAKSMQTVCLSGQHSQELLANKGCRLPPLRFALEPSGMSDQSSKLVAALLWLAEVNWLPVWPALAGAACQQRLPPSSSLLCTGAFTGFQPVEQA